MNAESENECNRSKKMQINFDEHKNQSYTTIYVGNRKTLILRSFIVI